MTCLQAQDDYPHSKGWAEMIQEVVECHLHSSKLNNTRNIMNARKSGI
jgi:hypothetical protein